LDEPSERGINRAPSLTSLSIRRHQLLMAIRRGATGDGFLDFKDAISEFFTLSYARA
jgi:hypothetical protein